MAGLRFCKCGAITKSGVCDDCKPKKQTQTERGYGSDWTRLSKRYRQQHPLCEDCIKRGKTTPAVEVHHIETITSNPSKRLDTTNLVALCADCHDDRHGGGGRNVVGA